MRKIILALILAAAAAMAVQAEEAEESDGPGDIGVGYQGIILGEFFNGASVRYNPDDSPIIAQLIYSRFSGDFEGVVDVDINILQGRLAYVVVENENSELYVGGKLGYVSGEVGGLGPDADFSGLTSGLLFGAEWSFAELPELGFNFDVGYDFSILDIEGTDIDLGGVNVTFGVHYYF